MVKIGEADLYDIARAIGYEGDDADADPPAELAARIEAMTPLQRARKWSQWHLGSPRWAEEFARLLGMEDQS